MSTTLIEDAPKTLWEKISYKDYFVIPRKHLKNPKKLSELFYEADSDSYGVFEWREAVDFLKLVDNENNI